LLCYDDYDDDDLYLHNLNYDDDDIIDDIIYIVYQTIFLKW